MPAEPAEPAELAVPAEPAVPAALVVALAMTVVEVVGNVAIKWLEKKELEGQGDASFYTGPIRWWQEDQGDGMIIKAENTDPKTDYLLFFSDASGEVALSHPEVLKPQGWLDATTAAKEFEAGTVSVGAVGETSYEQVDTKKILAAASLVRAATPLLLWAGIKGGVYFNQYTGWSFWIQSSGPIYYAKATTQDARGTSTTAEKYFGWPDAANEPAAYSYTLDLPDPIDLDPMAQSVEVELHLPNSAYEEALAEQRDRTF